jgi:DNA-binding XRE family transcriptional regulator
MVTEVSMSEAMTSPVRASRVLEAVRRDDERMGRAEREMGSRLVLARNVLRLRVGAGLTQADVAKRAGMSQPRIAELEAGRQNPTLDVLDRIAAAFSVTTAALLELRAPAAEGAEPPYVEAR